MTTATITEIRAAAQRLADAHRQSVTRATALEHALSEAAAPIYAAHRPAIDEAAAHEAECQAELQALIDGAPQLFARPRSILVDGVKCGYRKAEDGIDYDDEAAVIKRIKALLPDQSDLLVRSQESINVEAVAQLDSAVRRQIGIRSVSGADASFISFTDTDVEKLVKAILADAAKRQGEDEKPKAKTKRKGVSA
ncbi:hypothetical protein [Rhodocyclus tenuis]|uniref:Uncharacterized protein n=1 Tax=Rhodocyclus tenuis TaxID=1066 RepID=A0A840G8Z8_RHOTE|nr:hypothetical protein [Rhodocyclus tenuis]MBB4248345.1 hypothetical protein [Rhodocyclus tenuis]